MALVLVLLARSQGKLSNMQELEPQTAAGKVHLAFTMSLDGFVAGPGHSMDWMAGSTQRPGLPKEYIDATGAILAGRDGYDSAIGDSRPYGGAWKGPIFILTHHPEHPPPPPPPPKPPAPPRTSPSFPAPCKMPSGSASRPPAARISRCSRRTSDDSCCTSVWSTRSTFTSRPCSSATGSRSTPCPAARRSGSPWPTGTTPRPRCTSGIARPAPLTGPAPSQSTAGLPNPD